MRAVLAVLAMRAVLAVLALCRGGTYARLGHTWSRSSQEENERRLGWPGLGSGLDLATTTPHRTRRCEPYAPAATPSETIAGGGGDGGDMQGGGAGGEPTKKQTDYWQRKGYLRCKRDCHRHWGQHGCKWVCRPSGKRGRGGGAGGAGGMGPGGGATGSSPPPTTAGGTPAPTGAGTVGAAAGTAAPTGEGTAASTAAPTGEGTAAGTEAARYHRHHNWHRNYEHRHHDWHRNYKNRHHRHHRNYRHHCNHTDHRHGDHGNHWHWTVNNVLKPYGLQAWSMKCTPNHDNTVDLRNAFDARSLIATHYNLTTRSVVIFGHYHNKAPLHVEVHATVLSSSLQLSPCWGCTQHPLEHVPVRKHGLRASEQMAASIELGSAIQGAAVDVDRMSQNTADLALFTDTPDTASSVVPAMVGGWAAFQLHMNVQHSSPAPPAWQAARAFSAFWHRSWETHRAPVPPRITHHEESCRQCASQMLAALLYRMSL
ncbi:hypothetical protein JKP88DRAFT_247363 [Tribonema minus]|uniref:Uncharacterized protein n=1 Tax=Tribonema minus TaxID=303371 RepID=A0A836CAU6_9STRA|nr:hypothetical protein JKP88DRAFT_247363 [Tribonema minus]